MNSRLVLARSASRGFTLVEIILVTVIIMILVAITGPRIVGQGRIAKERATKIAMHGLKSALHSFELHASRFPSSAEGLKALILKPSDLSGEEWAGPYLDGGSAPKDSFLTEYKYACPSERGNDFDLISAGADKKFGTADDISLFAAEEPSSS